MDPEDFPYLAEEFAVNARLPGPGQRWLRHGAVLAGYAGLAALAIVLGPADNRVLDSVVAAAALAVLFPAVRVLGWWFFTRIAFRPSRDYEHFKAPGLRAALLSADLRQVILVTSTTDPGLKRRVAWASRFGRTGIIALSAYLKDERVPVDYVRFIAAHEAAHVVRDDTMTGTLLRTGQICLLAVVALTAPGSLWLLLPLVVVPVAVSWHTELACERMAVAAVGPVPARAYLGHYREVTERARSRSRSRRLIRRTRRMFTYAPPRIHRKVIAGALARQEQASPNARPARRTGSAGYAAGVRDYYAARLPIREQGLGPDHPDTLTMRHELARSTGDAGDAASALDQFTALLPIRERVLGPDHPDTLTTRHSLAYWTGMAGDAASARDQFTALLPIRERVLGPDHPNTSTTRTNLAYWTTRAGGAR